MKRTPLKRKKPLKRQNKPLKPIGRRGRRQQAPDAAWRAACKQRDGHRCVLCSKPSQHVHHILGKQANPHLRTVVANGACLCAPCHAWVHDNPATGRHKILRVVSLQQCIELNEKMRIQI